MNRTVALAGAAAVLHGPADILTTTYGRRTCPVDPEANPLVRELDPAAWIAIKAATLAPLAIVATVDGGGLARLVIDGLLAALVLGGLAVVLGNLYVVTHC